MTRVVGALSAALLVLPSLVGDAPKQKTDAPAKLSPVLGAPIRLMAAGKPIDTDVGHAGPFVGDFDGDGVKDLLVGQFGEGLLWIYKNEGTSAAPKLAAGVKFKDGGKDGRVPTG